MILTYLVVEPIDLRLAKRWQFLTQHYHSDEPELLVRVTIRKVHWCSKLMRVLHVTHAIVRWLVSQHSLYDAAACCVCRLNAIQLVA